MTNIPLFSIVTITLNNLEGLKKTEQSITRQTDQNYEWIIVDGGSNDGTVNYLSQVLNHTNWISEPDKGLYDAMNKGIDRATGQYIWFMNAGDQFATEDILTLIAKNIKTNDFDLIYGNALEDGNLKKSRNHTKINWGMFTHHQSMIYKTSTLKKHPYNLQYSIAADYDLTYTTIKKSKNICYLDYIFCIFEIGGISQKNSQIGRREQFFIRKKNNISALYNIWIYVAQIICFSLKSIFPSAYWFLKKKQRGDNNHIEIKQN